MQLASCSEQRERWGALTQPSSCFVTCTGDPCPHVPLSHLFLGFLPGSLGRTPLCLVWGSPGSRIAAGGALTCRMGVPRAVPRSLEDPKPSGDVGAAGAVPTACPLPCFFGAVSAAAKPGAKHPPIQQQRAPRRWLKYLVSSQPSKPEKSCPVVRYFRCNVFIRYIFKRMP